MSKLKNWRTDMGYSACKAAAMLGITRDYLYKLERGERKPSLEKAIYIQNITQDSVTLSDFLEIPGGASKSVPPSPS